MTAIQLKPSVGGGFVHPGEDTDPMGQTHAENYATITNVLAGAVALVAAKDLPHLTHNDLVYAHRFAQGNLVAVLSDLVSEPEPEALVDEIIVDFDEE